MNKNQNSVRFTRDGLQMLNCNAIDIQGKPCGRYVVFLPPNIAPQQTESHYCFDHLELQGISRATWCAAFYRYLLHIGDGILRDGVFDRIKLNGNPLGNTLRGIIYYNRPNEKKFVFPPNLHIINAYFAGARFYNTEFRGTVFHSDTALSGARFHWDNLVNVRFEMPTLIDVRFENSTLIDVRFANCRLNSAQPTPGKSQMAKIEVCYFREVVFKGVDFSGVTLDRPFMDECEFHGSFGKVEIIRGTFKNLDLVNCNPFENAAFVGEPSAFTNILFPEAFRDRFNQLLKDGQIIADDGVHFVDRSPSFTDMSVSPDGSLLLATPEDTQRITDNITPPIIHCEAWREIRRATLLTDHSNTEDAASLIATPTIVLFTVAIAYSIGFSNIVVNIVGIITLLSLAIIDYLAHPRPSLHSASKIID